MSEDPNKPKPGDPSYVGKGHPPRNGQFRQGESGNPRGRPARRRSRRIIDERQILADFFAVSEETYDVTVNGKTQSEAASRIIFRQLVAAAVNRQPWAIRRYVDLRMEYTRLYTDSLVRNAERHIRMKQVLEEMGGEVLSDEAKALIEEMKRRFENPSDELLDDFKE